METLKALLEAGLISEAEYKRHKAHWQRALKQLAENDRLVLIVSQNIK